MASPNPTSGVAVAAFVQATAAPVALTTTVAPSANHPVAQYAVTLSLANSATTTLTAVLKDVANTTVTSARGNVATFKAYCTQSAPSKPATTGSPDIVATIGASSGVIVAIAKGQVTVEVQFPVFDGTNANAVGMIYAQVVVTVTA